MAKEELITVKIEPDVKEKFIHNTESEGSTMSVEIRKFIHRYNRRVENSRIKHHKQGKITSTIEQDEDRVIKIDPDHLIGSI